MIKTAEIPYVDFVDSELGKMYSRLLFEAETSPNAHEREHGHWLRERLNERIALHARSYH